MLHKLFGRVWELTSAKPFLAEGFSEFKTFHVPWQNARVPHHCIIHSPQTQEKNLEKVRQEKEAGLPKFTTPTQISVGRFMASLIAFVLFSIPPFISTTSTTLCSSIYAGLICIFCWITVIYLYISSLIKLFRNKYGTAFCFTVSTSTSLLRKVSCCSQDVTRHTKNVPRIAIRRLLSCKDKNIYSTGLSR